MRADRLRESRAPTASEQRPLRIMSRPLLLRRLISGVLGGRLPHAWLLGGRLPHAWEEQGAPPPAVPLGRAAEWQLDFITAEWQLEEELVLEGVVGGGP